MPTVTSKPMYDSAAPASRGDERPTICQLLHGMSVGGAEVLAYRMALRLQTAYRFVFVCLDHAGELGEGLRERGFPVHVLERRSGVDVRCAWRLGRLLAREKVQVVHAHQYTPFFYALASRVFGGRTPILVTEHGRFYPDYPRRKRMVFNRLFLRRRDRIVGVGEAVRRALIDNEGIPAQRTSVIYNGIPLEAFHRANAADRAAIRREIGLDEDAFAIIQVARLDHLKDHRTAVRAMARVVAKCPRAKLVLVGEGPERGAIEAEIERLGMGEHVRLLGLRQDVARLLAVADACLLTSISEGIPLTLIEAMAARLPVVATDVGGVAEVVDVPRTGLLSASGDDAALAAALLELAADTDRRSSMGELGCRRAHEMFSEEQMHAAYAGIFDEILCRQTAPVVAAESVL